jgi:ribosomal protein S18 acetylase RimI-like enzyme
MVLRPGRADDARDFARLALEAAPSFLPSLFGSKVGALLARLYGEQRNLFSYEHVRFLEADGLPLGMVLGYDGRAQADQRVRTGWLLARFLPSVAFRHIVPLVRADAVLGCVRRGDYYVSNLAVAPRARGAGLGSHLLAEVERDAAAKGLARVVLDAETDNEGAVRLYRRLGYGIERSSPLLPIGRRVFQFRRMAKGILPAAT